MQDPITTAAAATGGSGGVAPGKSNIPVHALVQPPPPPLVMKRPLPTAPGAHDAGIEYGEIAADIAADNMAAHIAAMADNMPPPPPAGRLAPPPPPPPRLPLER